MSWKLGESKKIIQRDDVEFYFKKDKEYKVTEIQNKSILKAVDLVTGIETDILKDTELGLDSQIGDTVSSFEIIKKRGKDVYKHSDNFNNLYVCDFLMNETNGSYSATKLNRIMKDNCESYFKLSRKPRNKFYVILSILLFSIFFSIYVFANNGFSNTPVNIICVGLFFSVFYIGRVNRNKFYKGNIQMKEDTLKSLKENIHNNPHSVLPNSGNEDWLLLGLSDKEAKKIKNKNNQNI